MMYPTHHPDDALLLDYAAGSLDEATSLVIATHAALCPVCRRRIAAFESVGGDLLEDLDPLAINDAGLDSVLALINGPAETVSVKKAQSVPLRSDAALLGVPRPLRDYMSTNLETIAWKPIKRGLGEMPIVVGAGRAVVKLLKIAAGTGVPQHTHEGNEFTLVLQGGFTDTVGHFIRGDIAITDPSIDHRPVADEGEDCISLAVTDAPLRLTGPIGRWVNPFVRY